MKYLSRFFQTIFSIGLFFMFYQTVSADGFIIIDPPLLPLPNPQVDLAVKYHHVDVEIANQVAQVEIDQVFVNKNDYEVEGIYIFPLPENAVLSQFSMYADGEKLEGEILDKDEAQEIYESKVRQLIDPAILEYVGRGMYKARIYPISANSEKRIQLSYTQIIPKDNNNLRFIYPLNTEKFSSENLESVRVVLNINHTNKIKTLYSPSHSVAITRPDDYSAQVSYEAHDVKPDLDFELLIGEDQNDVGLSLLNYKEADDDGYFMLLASPKVEIDESERLPKDIVFVLDTSGSMDGEKIAQAKDALIYSLDQLKSENKASAQDRFSLISFSDTVNAYQSELKDAHAQSIEAAQEFVEGLEALGGTNINDSLQAALEIFDNQDRSKTIIFLTDGEATVGEIETAQIVQNVRAKNNNKVKIFVFGVGDDVNTHLLDFISGDSQALSTYVGEDESIESYISGFYDKISYPFLSNIELNFPDGLEVYDLYPTVLPDIYKGSQLVLLGRYKNSTNGLVHLAGDFKNIEKGFSIQANFPNQKTTYDYLPALWAARKIGYLMDQIRLYGDDSNEIRESIIKLSKQYGIITEYTSFLIDFDEPTNSDDFLEKATDYFNNSLEEEDFDEDTGGAAQKAVQQTQTLQRFDNLSQNKELTSNGESKVRQLGNKVFYFQNEKWVDNDYVDQDLTPIYYGTEEYFNLIAIHQSNGQYLALGKNVTFCNGDDCYDIIDNEESQMTGFQDLSSAHWAVEYIEQLVENGVVQGYLDGTIRPDYSITRAEFLKLIFKALSFDLLQKQTEEISFSDVETNAWYYFIIKDATENGVVSGYADGTFRPNNLITRAEAIKILITVLGAELNANSDNVFRDLSETNWAYRYISKALELEVVSGYADGTFRPQAPITRAEAMKIISEAQNAKRSEP